MYETTRGATHVRLFDSVEDLIESAAAARSANLRNVCPMGREAWVGRDFASWEEVYAAARSPWPEGLEVVEGMAAELADADLPKPLSRKRRLRWSDDSGDEVDYDRLRGGSDYWRASHRSCVRGPQVVTLVIDVNAHTGIKHHDILWRGAAALAMTRVLEDADYRVEIWVAHRAAKCYGDGWGHFHAVCLKRPGDPLDVGTLVSAVSGWFYRSLMFRAKGIGSKAVVKNLGVPCCPGLMVEEITHGEVVEIGGTYNRYGAIYLAREALRRLVTPPAKAEPEPESETELVAVATPAAPPPPMSAADKRRAAAEARKNEREYKRWAKEWARVNVENS